MNKTLRNILGLIIGLFVGALVNMAITEFGYSSYKGTHDISQLEGLRSAMPEFTFMDYFYPFLAHALGVFAGAFTAAKICATNKRTFALVIGVLFLIGGIIMSTLLWGIAPMSFIFVDLILAYIPFAFLGAKVAKA